MALAKRSLMKEQTIDHSVVKTEENEILKRRKRPVRDDEIYKQDEKQYYPQKKRALGAPQNNRQHNPRQNSEDQDDETLIRETQAALKSLSGSFPDSRGSLFKINDQDESPAFQNLFEVKNNARRMSPIISTANNQSFAESNDYLYRDPKNRNDIRNYQKHRRDEYAASSKNRLDSMKSHSQYQSHDFNELMDDSSGELQIDMVNGVHKDDGSYVGKSSSGEERCKNNEVYLNYPGHRGAQFSQNSAFRPPIDKRASGLSLPMTNPYLHSESGYGPYAPDMSGVMGGNGDKEVKMHIKDEELSKSADSPDSKHYTILQPAVGSKAASVMQDIAREGVVSVPAVSSSTSSPELTSTMATDKIAYDRPMPPFSPGSSSKGNI